MRGGRGFTLVELLVSLSIFAVAAAALASAFSSGLTVWRRARRETSLRQAARATLERVGRDLRNALPVPGAAFEGSDGAMTFYFYRPAPPLSSVDRSGIYRVTYRPAEGAWERVESPVRPAEPVEEFPDPSPLPGSAHFSYAYAPSELDGALQWRSRWAPKEGLPAAVRVDLRLKDEEGHEIPFQKTIELPLGTLHLWKDLP